MITTIYINGVRMDAPDNLNITLTYRSAAFVAVDKLNNSYSNTITLPRTAHNEAALGGVVFPSTESSLPYKYLPAKVQIGGVMVVQSAVAYITEITEDAIKVAVVWDSVVKLAAIVADGRQLNELPYDYASDAFLWDKTSASSFPTANYGFADNDQSTAKHPVYKVKEILQRVCDAYDIPMPPDTDLTQMEKWSIPLTTRIDPVITEGEPLTQNNVSHWYGTQVALLRAVESRKGTGETQYTNVHELWCGRIGKASGVAPDDDLPDINIPINPLGDYSVAPLADGELEDLDTPIVDNDGNPAGSLTPPDFVSRELRGIVGGDGTNKYLRYFVPKNPNMEFICSGNLFFPLKANNTATASFISGNLKLCLMLLYRPKDSDYTVSYNEEELLTISTYSVDSSGVRFKFDNEKSAEIPHPLMGETDVYNNLDCRLQWRLVYKSSIAGHIGLTVGVIGNSTTPNNDKALTIIARMKNVQLGTLYYPVPNYPQITVISFLKAIGQMSGRFLTIDTKVAKIGVTYKVMTVTRFRSYSELEEGKANAYDWSDYLIRGTGSVETMQFHVGEWGQRNTFAYKEGKTWEEVDEVDFFIQNKSLKTEYKAVELPYTAAISKDDKQTLYLPLYHYEENNPRAVYDGGDDSAYIAEASGGRLRCTLGWENLINNYAQLFSALRNVKVVKEQMRIPLPVLQTIDLYRPVYLRQYGCYFAIIEMRTRSEGLVDVELLKI